MAENKIKYGIKSCYYCIATIAADGSATYSETVKPLPGAVSIALDPQGERTPFYADNIEYWVGGWNNGYEGDLTLARVPDDFHSDILGDIVDGKGLLVEDAKAEAVHFALMFQFEGDQKATRHVLYNCTASRTSINGNTKEDTVTPETEAITITAKAVYNATLDTDIVKAKTTESTDTTAYNAWFTAVQQPTAPTP